ncbi:MAG: DinB family protein [Planctomycetota bacterium]
MKKPPADEFADYQRPYLELLPDGDALEILDRQGAELKSSLAKLDEESASRRPEPGKWSVKDVIQHLCDSERVMTYRALCAARGDTTPLPGFDQDRFAASAAAAERLLAEHQAVRNATIAMFRGLHRDSLSRRGTAGGRPCTPRAEAWLAAAHEAHHWRLLRERLGVAR